MLIFKSIFNNLGFRRYFGLLFIFEITISDKLNIPHITYTHRWFHHSNMGDEMWMLIIEADADLYISLFSKAIRHILHKTFFRSNRRKLVLQAAWCSTHGVDVSVCAWWRNCKWLRCHAVDDIDILMMISHSCDSSYFLFTLAFETPQPHNFSVENMKFPASINSNR